MATPLTGRYCSFQVSTGTTGVVQNLGRWEVNITMDEMDASCFGDVWKANMTGMQGWNGTIEGFFDPSTTGHQIITVLKDAVQATKIQDIRFYLTTATSWWFMPPFNNSTWYSYDADAGAYFSNVRIGAEKNSLISFSASVLGYGALVLTRSSDLEPCAQSTG